VWTIEWWNGGAKKTHTGGGEKFFVSNIGLCATPHWGRWFSRMSWGAKRHQNVYCGRKTPHIGPGHTNGGWDTELTQRGVARANLVEPGGPVARGPPPLGTGGKQGVTLGGQKGGDGPTKGPDGSWVFLGQTLDTPIEGKKASVNNASGQGKHPTMLMGGGKNRPG